MSNTGRQPSREPAPDPWGVLVLLLALELTRLSNNLLAVIVG